MADDEVATNGWVLVGDTVLNFWADDQDYRCAQISLWTMPDCSVLHLEQFCLTSVLV